MISQNESSIQMHRKMDLKVMLTNGTSLLYLVFELGQQSDFNYLFYLLLTIFIILLLITFKFLADFFQS